jgi:hypothetical protein
MRSIRFKDVKREVLHKELKRWIVRMRGERYRMRIYLYAVSPRVATAMWGGAN